MGNLADMLLESRTMKEELCPSCRGSGVDLFYGEEICVDCDGGGTIWVEKLTLPILKADLVCSYLEVYEEDGWTNRTRYYLTNPHVLIESDRDLATEFHIRGIGKLLVRGWGVDPDTRERFFICYIKEKEKRT